MCGLVGIAGKLTALDEAIFKRLLVFDTIRGLDATGVATVRHATKAIEVVKIASHPFDLFGMKRFDTAVTGYTSSVFLGHNRSATTGAKNAYNAHPFQFGDIVGAHNGTLDRTSWTRLEDAVGEQFDVDSAAVFCALSKLGLKDTIELMEHGKHSNAGAWALSWYDKSNDTLNFIRNEHRPLWYAYSEDFDKLYWASEWPMLQAATRTGAQAKLYHNKDGHCFFPMAEDTHYSFKLEDLRSNSDKIKPEPMGDVIKGREPVEVKHTQPPFQTFGTAKTGTVTTPSNTQDTGTTNRFPKMITLKTPEHTYLDDIIDRSDFEYSASGGCHWCGNEVLYGDEGITLFEDEGIVLCGDCGGNHGHTRVYAKPKEFLHILRTTKEYQVS
jgi:hypothetical protein